MAFSLERMEIDPDAARQYMDARAAFVELERSRKNALQVRGESSGSRWTINITSSVQARAVAKRAWAGVLLKLKPYMAVSSPRSRPLKTASVV